MVSQGQADNGPPSRRLREAMLRRGIRNRELARLLAGPAATREQIEKERRAVLRWLNGASPNQANARRLAVALGEPPDAFVSPPARRVAGGELGELADEMAVLRARVGLLEESLSGLVETQRSVGDELQALLRLRDELRDRASRGRGVRSSEDAPP